MTLNDPISGFKVTPFFDAEYLRNGTRHRHSFNGNRDLYTPYSTVSFRMTLSDLANYSMTRSVARSLCDSWDSCFIFVIGIFFFSGVLVHICCTCMRTETAMQNPNLL